VKKVTIADTTQAIKIPNLQICACGLVSRELNSFTSSAVGGITMTNQNSIL
jgi:hypothetical protein